MKLLHVVATPRHAKSNTLQVSDAFLKGLLARRGDLVVEAIDLYDYILPDVAGDNIEAKYARMTGQPADPGHAASWRQIETLIERFLSADAYLISAPMWNFGIPYVLKYYIDCIVQPGYVFRYDEAGRVVPMVHGKRMLCVTSRGGDYSPGGPLHAYDFQEPYLRSIFGFIGISDIHFISAQPMDVTPGLRATAVATAIAEAESLAGSPVWA
jgi:FMN-dependent NADH-azoreductase